MLDYFVLILIVSISRASYDKLIDKITADNITDYDLYQRKMQLLDPHALVIEDLNSLQLLQESCVDNEMASCPPWSFCENGKNFVCPQQYGYILKCDMNPNVTKKLLIMDCNCITYDKKQKIFEFGLCFYNCAIDIYHSMPENQSEWNQFLCGPYERSGSLCGKCDEDLNLYHRAYSFDMSCIQCTPTKVEWLKYLIAAYFPLTVFCFIILLFKINISSSQIQGYILYCQFVSISAFSRGLFNVSHKNYVLSQITKFLITLYGVWNLDFFRMYYPGFCLQTGTLASLSLDFGVAVYPLVLMALTYGLVRLHDKNVKLLVTLWNPFQIFFGIFQNKWEIRTSIIDSFSTFFFLSSMKILSVCFDIIVPVKVYQFTDARIINHTWRLYYDATVPYFEGSNFYYGLLALLAFFPFVLLPVLILLLYPFRPFQQALNILPSIANFCA